MTGSASPGCTRLPAETRGYFRPAALVSADTSSAGAEFFWLTAAIATERETVSALLTTEALASLVRSAIAEIGRDSEPNPTNPRLRHRTKCLPPQKAFAAGRAIEAVPRFPAWNSPGDRPSEAGTLALSQGVDDSQCLT